MTNSCKWTFDETNFMLQNFEVRVISLIDQMDRRRKIFSTLGEGPLVWKFFDAISGRELSTFHLGFYDRARRLRALGYDMKDNEIACFLSHRLVWEECVRTNRPYLILEDDIKINSCLSGIEEVISLANELVSVRAEDLYVRLGFLRNGLKFFPLGSLSESVELVRFEKDPSTAMAYLIAPEVAQKLLLASEKFHMPVDDFMWRGWSHGNYLLDVLPAFFYTSDEDTPSNIGARVKPKIGWWAKINREYFRFIENTEKFFYERSAKKRLRGCLWK